MNVYDAAHNLAKAIRESEAYRKYKELDQEIHTDGSLKDMIESFQKFQIDLQAMQMTGQALDEKKLNEAQTLFEKLNKDPKASAYFEAELKLNQMMGDVSKILGDAMDFRSEYKES